MKISGSAKKEDPKLSSYVQRGKEEAQDRIEAAREGAAEFVDARADQVGEALDRMSDALRNASDAIETAGLQLGTRGEEAAGRVDRASTYLRKNDATVFVRDIEDLSRRHIGWTVGLAFAAGVVAARLGRH